MKNYFILSPAKINLTLQVLKKRKDNYHEIYTIFQKIDLFDEIEIRRGVRSFSLKFFCNVPIPLEENLVYKAYKLFKKTFNIKEDVAIKVKKTIPICAGLGGGSSNAASVLKGLAYLYGIKVENVYPLAKTLGADVTFFLTPYPSAIGKGIGDELNPFPNFSAWYVLISPNFRINTKWAYENLGLTKSKNPIYYTSETPPWYQPQGLINDFEPLVFKKYKILQKYKETLKNLGASAVSLSGTGPSIFAVFDGDAPFFIYKYLKLLIKDCNIFLVKNWE
ncbi:MAG: 4-(cytidine 5'-diphospho)-2-C-methyl-D-erythritol kinase [Thermodesulfobacterium sp.]|nr:4-(cytidine 5'-diphospho)-2-C-methyl-D-erythritol kinase [Thermodesulfobacterium sp.]